ncbi:hypothetical protein B0H12DRAFT_1075780 [Mycena haematopus]|nr:hypothetical protein B0H12DRAFT_1075780 [Mycena haematopus]
MHANGDVNDPVVLAQYKDIIDTIDYEKNVAEPLSLRQMASKRIAESSVNSLSIYTLGIMLNDAGITNTTTQLQINVILNAFCLLCALAGTYYIDRLGRKRTAMITGSITSLTIFLFMVGALTKSYGLNSTNTSGIYATAMIFLFQGAYSFGWTPLLLMAVFAFPFALENIGWKTYMINAAWDALEIPFVWWYWVETANKTLEEIDELLDGVKHNTAQDLERVIREEAAARERGISLEKVDEE